MVTVTIRVSRVSAMVSARLALTKSKINSGELTDKYHFFVRQCTYNVERQLTNNALCFFYTDEENG